MALIPLFKRNAVWLNCLDFPNERKIHLRPMPKVGGLAMAIGALIPLLMWDYGDRLGISLLVGSSIIVLIGFMDDSRDISWPWKLAAQVSAALIVVFVGDIKIGFIDTLLPAELSSDLAVSIVTVIAIVGVTNAVNLADGLDGLAGAIMLVSFTCIGFLADIGGNQLVTLVSVAATGAILGFLPYNTHPATVFMGDTGSQLLGFLAGTMSLIVTQTNPAISPILPLFLVGLPVIDTVMVIFERISRGRLPFLADTRHIHHKLIRMNFYHSEAVVVLFALQCGFVATGYFLRFHSEWFLLTAYMVLAMAIITAFVLVDRKSLRFPRPNAFDRRVKQRLRVHIKEDHFFIALSQKFVEYGLPFLIIITCLLPGRMPRLVSILAAVLIGVIGLAHVIWPAAKGNVLRLAIYFFMPFVIYYSETRMATWVSTEWQIAYNLLFIVLLFFAIITLRTTRRKHFFKLSALDYVLLFTAIIVPNLPFLSGHNFQLGPIAAKIIVLVFIFEVMTGELKGRKSCFNWGAVAALLVVVVRAVV
jgi:UDP-GlcNAc:undecaprenyl-phosphate GlcNAc-1-phosphate transferase